ncbi:hypothetical protein L7F22_040545 [Adiantum nelumboides]|nr:hypothetical protein [Adiantum nelumboides]
MKHQKGGCNLVPKHNAFLFYLGLLIDTQPQDPQLHSETEQETSEADAPISFQSVSTIENLEKTEKLEEEPIDLVIEEKESANFDVALFRATTAVDEPTEDNSISETSLTLVHLPFFHINGKDYITLHSIQSLFNIREDYCIDAIAEASQVAKEFVDIEGESKEEFCHLSWRSNQKFLKAPDAFGLCLKRLAKEEPALKDEDFETRLVELGIEKFGRNIVELEKISSDMGAKINPEHEGRIEANELQKIELLDEDNFLGRAGEPPLRTAAVEPQPSKSNPKDDATVDDAEAVAQEGVDAVQRMVAGDENPDFPIFLSDMVKVSKKRKNNEYGCATHQLSVEDHQFCSEVADSDESIMRQGCIHRFNVMALTNNLRMGAFIASEAYLQKYSKVSGMEGGNEGPRGWEGLCVNAAKAGAVIQRLVAVGSKCMHDSA